MVIILDDRTDIWGNIDNLININAFFFFKEEKNRLNYVKEKFLKDDDDQILFSKTLTTTILKEESKLDHCLVTDSFPKK